MEKFFIMELEPFIIAGRFTEWELPVDILQNHIINFYKDHSHPENLEKGINDIYRVLNTNGMIAILEFSKPRSFPIKQVYHFYFRYITPLIVKIFSKDNSAYTYLPESVKAFPDGEDFLNVLKKAGFKETKAIPVTFGVASIYIAKK